MEQPDGKRRFTLPSAYTILFALIVLMAIATWMPTGSNGTRSASVVHDMKGRQRPPLPRPGRRRRPGPDAKHKTILAVFGLAFVVMMYGVIP